MTRGRPRKAGARKPSGDLRQVKDTGTSELRAQRDRLVGDADDRRAESVLGVLHARGLLFRGDVSAGRRYSVGRRYAELFNRGVRNPLAIPTLLRDAIAAGSLPLATALLSAGAAEEAGAEARADFLAAHKALEARGDHVVRSVERTCVYDDPPRHDRELEMLRDGLDALHQHFEETDARSRAATAKAA